MCGIVAVIRPAGGLSQGDVARAVEVLRHRGPDDASAWASACGRAAFGHTRLAIIDRAGGGQPMHSADGRLHLIANGEFYGYEAIREELLRQGRRLLTRSDTEIAVHLYDQSGVGAMQRLRGEFAFAIWDDERGELFAARDRFGIKPLYYARHAGAVYLASEIKALLALGVPARWDAESLAAHLLVCYPADRTLFEGIRQVPPGCLLRTDGADIRVEGYWDLDFPLEADLPTGGDLEAHLATVREAVVESIRVRLRADVPVAAHLSGGLDSGSIVGVVSRSTRPATFTVRFDDARFDESAVARLVAEHTGARHTEIAFHSADFVKHIERTVVCGEMLQENSHGIARLLQSQAISGHGYPVVLAGEGGDEVFAGYPQSQQDLALSLSPAARAQAQAGYARLAATPGASGHLRLLLDRLGFVPSWILDRYLSLSSTLTALLSPSFAQLLSDSAPCADLLDGPAGASQIAGRSPFHQSTYLFYKTWLCNYLLAAERLDMAHALEVRLPYLDHHVLDAVKPTPLAWYAGSVPKPLLRGAMREYLAPGVAYARKQGFFAPSSISDIAVLARVREIASRDAIEALPFFDHGAVRALLDRLVALPAERRASYDRVVQLLTGIVVLTGKFGMTA